MSLFPNVTGTIANGGDPKMRWDMKKSCLSVSTYNRLEGKYQNIPVKEAVLMDFGSARHGWERFLKGKPYGLVLVPIIDDVPEQPDDDYHAVGAIGAIVPSIGRVELIVDNEKVSDLLSGIYEQYEIADQAANGLLPFVVTHKYRTDGWFIRDWEERKERFLGPRLVPAPVPCTENVASDEEV
jgi:hypothetical protein